MFLKQRKNTKLNQDGNVLFLILIAVALFAALSFAVTRVNHGSVGTVDSEKAETKYSVLYQYINRIQTQVLRMQTIEGVKNPRLLDRGTGFCNAQPEQCIFETVFQYDGADIEAITDISNSGFFDRTTFINNIPDRRVFAYLQVIGVTEKVCQSINEFAQVENIPQITDDRSYDDLTFFERSQPLLCARIGGGSPANYNILMKAYDATYV